MAQEAAAVSPAMVSSNMHPSRPPRPHSQFFCCSPRLGQDGKEEEEGGREREREHRGEQEKEQDNEGGDRVTPGSLRPSHPFPPPAAPGPLARSIREQGGSRRRSTSQQVRQLVGEWTTEISRHGLTSATVVRDHLPSPFDNNTTARDRTTRGPAGSAAGEQRQPPGSGGTATTLGLNPAPSPSPHAALRRRRVSSNCSGGNQEGEGSTRSGSSANNYHWKKPRLGAPGKLHLGTLLRPQFANPSADSMSMPRRLVSHTAEETARMIDRIQDDPEPVTTHQLAKGSVNLTSPLPQSANTPLGSGSGSRSGSGSGRGSWPSPPLILETTAHSAWQRTPDGRPLPAHLQVLQNIGVIELLEQDERPVFVVDLVSSALCANAPVSQLDILFANAALRASRSMLNLLVVGTTTTDDDDDGNNDGNAAAVAENDDFDRFKTWVLFPDLGRHKEARSKGGDGGGGGGDCWLPSLWYGGVRWTRSTLRKRFRVVSGSQAAVAMTPTSPSGATLNELQAIHEERTRGPTPERYPLSPHEHHPSGGTGDYFGAEASTRRLQRSSPKRRSRETDERSSENTAASLAAAAAAASVAASVAAATAASAAAAAVAAAASKDNDDDDDAKRSDDGIDEKVVAGLYDSLHPDDASTRPEDPSDDGGSGGDASSSSAATGEMAVKPSFDWTRIEVTPSLSPHIRFARSIDWASTPLGPIDSWPADLRTMSNMIMGTPYPAALYWGPEFTILYNEAYIRLVGQKHPRMMGANYPDVWPEIWELIEPVFDKAWNHGEALMKHDDRLFVVRNGFLEETFFNWSVIPLVGGDGQVVALYNPAFENTRRKVNERRMLTLREVGEKTSLAKDVKGFWALVLKGLEYNEYDVPFVMIYSAPDGGGDSSLAGGESDVSSLHSGTGGGGGGRHSHSATNTNPPLTLVLEGSHGVPEGHPVAVPSIDLRTCDEGFAPYMREALARSSNSSNSSTHSAGGPSGGNGDGSSGAGSSGGPVVLSKEAGTLPLSLIEGLEWRGFGDPCGNIVVFPVHMTTTESVVGFIVMGTNPRRPYNEDYALFVQLLSRQLATTMASVVLFEEEIRRGQRAARVAALDRQELALQLRLRTQEAVESEYKFTRMAEFAPVGIFITNPRGSLTYCNDMWWEISRHKRSSGSLSGSVVTVHGGGSGGGGGGSSSSGLVTATSAAAAEDEDDGMATDAWMQSVLAEDRPGLEAVWRKMVTEKAAITQYTFRFKAPSQIEGHPVDTWVLLSAFPEKDEQGGIKRVFGCMTDISQQKWAETVQRQRREEAVELKRQQENFIDMTSHEMRNPLSAILQCSDEITNGLARWKADGGLGVLASAMADVSSALSAPAPPQPQQLQHSSEAAPPPTFATPAAALADLESLIDGSVEAANTISLCASHQKRIVDDILTFSKLDSQLLLVTPVDAQPVATVQNVLRMFEPELRSNDISLEFRVEPSYGSRDLAVDWVKIDPSRMRQVLINLVTNAIKFTTSCERRSIVVSLGAAVDHDDGEPPEGSRLVYFPSRDVAGSESLHGGHRGSSDFGAGTETWTEIGSETWIWTEPGLSSNAHQAFASAASSSSSSIAAAATATAATATAAAATVDKKRKKKSLTDGADWGTGEKIYLTFAVTDTGPGLDDEEKKVLFQRFSQASPRTHVQYGGSGLGLYICRTLSELQGGQISVTSEKGVGSTFAFYIKARRSDPNNLSPSAVLPPQGSPFGPPSQQQPDEGADPAVQYSVKNSDGSNSTTTTAATTTAEEMEVQALRPLASSESPPPPPSHLTQDVVREASMAAPSSPSPGPAAEPAPPTVKALQFPAQAAPPTSSSSTPPPPLPGSAAATTGHTSPPLDVLIVEDNVVNQRVLQRQLRRCGNNTLVANHGGEALETLQRSRFWRSNSVDSPAPPPPPLQRPNDPTRPTTTPSPHPSPSTGGTTATATTTTAAAAGPRGGGLASQGQSVATIPSSSPLSPRGSISGGTSNNKRLEVNLNVSVILMDLEMPVMDGMTCARRIRELEREGTILHHIPIIAVTAYARPEQIETAKAAGIDDVISKPFRVPELIPKIEELVARYNTRADADSDAVVGTGQQQQQQPTTTTTTPSASAAAD